MRLRERFEKWRRGRRFNPPHVIAWRLLWWVPIQLAIALLLLLVLVSHGPAKAREVRELLR